jgi:Ser/Thr protein kinase RdoA (MazF antagonist)
MSVSIPLRDPAWDGISALPAASFSHSVVADVSRWVSTQAAPRFLTGSCRVVGALRAAGSDQRAGHFLLECQDGTFVLHVKRTAGASDVASAAALSERLIADGLSVACYLRTAVGEPEILIDGLAVTATDYVPARHRSESIEDASALGAALGRLHAALCHDPEATTVEARNAAARRRLMEMAVRLRSGAYAAIPPEYQGMVRAAAGRLDASYEFAGASQRLHGDVTPGNVLYLADGTARICDFENSAFSFWPVALDLASAVLRFCLEPLDPTLSRPSADAAERREALTSAYAQTGRTLPHCEVLDRSIRNLVDQNIVIRSIYDVEMGMHSEGEWRKIARLDQLAHSVAGSA